MFGIENFSVAWRDILDIAIVTVLMYGLILMFKGTRAIAVANGILILTIVYLGAQELGLYTLGWILESIFASIFLVIVIIFQDDIRKALANIGSGQFFVRKKRVNKLHYINILAGACTKLAKDNIGALIVLENKLPLGEIYSKGIEIDGKVSAELLETIFFPKTALHDGAIVINNKWRLVAAGCILPLADEKHSHYGTRHRAAIGLTQECDAIVIVVSEERGQINIVQDGKMSGSLNSEQFIRKLDDAFI